MKTLTLKNGEMEIILNNLQPILAHRDKIGYVAARNTRIIKDALTEYLEFKRELIKKYGTVDETSQTVSINPDSEHFKEFVEEFDKIKDVEQEINIITIKYDEIIGLLNGEEILDLDWMFEE